MATERNETIEHLKTFYQLLLSESSDRQVAAKLWKTDPEAYGTTIQGADAWASEGLGMSRAANMLKSAFGF